MPARRRTIGSTEVAQLSEALFTPCGGELVGLELEWPTHRHSDVASRPAYSALVELDGSRLPAGSRITVEPGGQVELSTAPFASVSEAVDAARLDSRALFARMAAAGLTCQTIAVDDRRPPERILDKPRYAAMEAFFDAQGPSGRWMMTNTASTQINVSHDPMDPALRWELLSRIAPALVAAFANSPGVDTAGRHWTSLRQAIWWSIDPTRTRPVRTDIAPAQAWAEYALTADVMFIAGESSAGETAGRTTPVRGLSFGRWLTQGHELGWPTIEDLHTHLTTLFPPVRPRGWLELRVLDALAEWIREVAALTVVTACSSGAAQEILDRLAGVHLRWLAAIRDGLADPAVAAAARLVFDVVGDHLDAVAPDRTAVDRVSEYRARYADRGRCPGDDLPSEFDMRGPCLLRAAGAA